MRNALFFFLAACAPISWDDLRTQGEAETWKLAELLHTIDTKEELQSQLPKIKKSYDKMADLILAVRESGEGMANDPSDASDALFAELARLYEMPGCRALIEESQSEAMDRLIH